MQKLVLNENLRFLDLFSPGENKLSKVHIQVENKNQEYCQNIIFCSIQSSPDNPHLFGNHIYKYLDQRSQIQFQFRIDNQQPRCNFDNFLEFLHIFHQNLEGNMNLNHH